MASLATLAPAAEPTTAAVREQVPVPAIVQSVTFGLRDQGEDRKVVVTSIPARWRIDAATDGYSILYNPKTEYYIGLENRNYTYWEFSWPGVKSAVQNTKRYEARLRDLGADGLNSSASDTSLGGEQPPFDTNLPDATPPAGYSAPSVSTTVPLAAPPPTATASVGTDDSGYIWKPTDEHKNIAGMDCVKWTGESVSNEPASAWCYAGLIPQVETSIAELRTVNEPIALVPVRNLVPDFIFAVNDSLARGGVTPLLILWGDASDQSHFGLLSIKNHEGRADLFSVPKMYVKTTLITMDGIGDQKPPGVYQPINPPKTRASPYLP
jgi:hypothetical protein